MPSTRGTRLLEKRKQKAQAQGQPPKPAKRQKRAACRAAAADAGSHLIIEGKDNDEQSDLVLMYNTVQGYVSVIRELWSYQTS